MTKKMDTFFEHLDALSLHIAKILAIDPPDFDHLMLRELKFNLKLLMHVARHTRNTFAILESERLGRTIGKSPFRENMELEALIRRIDG